MDAKSCFDKGNGFERMQNENVQLENVIEK